MKVRAVRSFIDKYSMEDVDKGTEFEVSEERFSELTTGPRGVFVEEIKEIHQVEPSKDSESQKDNTSDESIKNEASITEKKEEEDSEGKPAKVEKPKKKASGR